MFMESATKVRQEWSAICDSVIHEKPKFIRCTRDKMWYSNLTMNMNCILAAITIRKENIITEKTTNVTMY